MAIINNGTDIECLQCGENFCIFNEDAWHEIVITIDGKEILKDTLCSRCLPDAIKYDENGAVASIHIDVLPGGEVKCSE